EASTDDREDGGLTMAGRANSVVSLAILIAASACAYGSLAAETATVCQLKAAPAQYDGRIVRVRARGESDGFESAALMDENCPNAVLAVGPEPWTKDEKELRRFLWAIARVHGGLSHDHEHILRVQWSDNSCTTKVVSSALTRSIRLVS